MNKKYVLSAFLALTLAATVVSAQPRVEFLPAGDGDLAASGLVAPLVTKAGPQVPREAVAFSRPLGADEALAPPAPFVARSREYFVEVTADELARGVPVYATSPGALVRLNPAPSASRAGRAATEKAAVDPLDLVLVDGRGRTWHDGNGMDRLAGAEELAQTGVPFAAGTSAFRLGPELGAGGLEVRAPGLSGSSRYLMHVFDAGSDLELTVRTSRAGYLHGQTLAITASLARGSERFEARQIDGFVSSPAGRAWPVKFRRVRSGAYRATLKLDAVEAPAPGLWEAHVSVNARVDGQGVLRNTRTAFACAVPSARLTGEAGLATGAGESWVLALGVEAAAAGRYDVRGVLYGTAPDGSLKPAGLAQSAAWLEAGAGVLELELSREILAAGLTAPYEVRDLRLTDQGRMGVLHQQARALVIR